MGRLLHSKDTNRAAKTNPFRVLSLLLVASCQANPVEWGDIAYRQSQLGDPDARSAILSAGLPTVPGTVGQCLRSVRGAGNGQDGFRAWWASRSDSSVVLAVQHSGDLGATWDPMVVAENGDKGGLGCARPRPDIFYDAKSGNVLLTYFIEATDGPGVFFTHSMDKGRMFHSPVPVVYGSKPSHASVTGNGDSVAVVFEDPNSTSPRIGIVLSATTGHIFEQRGEVTPYDVRAVRPWVGLDHSKITVWWTVANERGDGTGRVGYRQGTWR